MYWRIMENVLLTCAAVAAVAVTTLAITVAAMCVKFAFFV